MHYLILQFHGSMFFKLVEKTLKNLGANFEVLNEEKLIEKTAEDLSKGHAIGWFQGRMEFGPRALGARSIIADPRSETMQKKLNLKINFSFHPPFFNINAYFSTIVFQNR